jgi:putative SOS response-associated peptidase YedK
VSQFLAGLESGGTFTIVTRPALPALEALHHRQPVLLEGSSALAWLESSLTSADVLGLFETDAKELVITPEHGPESAQLSLF